MELKDLSSNWKKLQASMNVSTERTSTTSNKTTLLKRKRDGQANSSIGTETIPKKKRARSTYEMEKGAFQREVSRDNQLARGGSKDGAEPHHDSVVANEGLSSLFEIGKYIAIDCEMVGVGPNPDKESALARVSIVNFNGNQIYDSYVKPKEQVTDWRTHVSGIAPKHMIGARSLETVQADVTKIFQDRILVGHAIRNDLDALLLSHPKRDIRDTARHPPYRDLAGGASPRLKVLASQLLGLEIQTGEHSSVEDAQACMLLFRRDKDAFEREHAKKWPNQVPADRAQHSGGAPSKPPKKQKKKKR